MWKFNIRKFSRELNNLSKRTYLSEAYKLNSEWERRLATPILQKINAENLFVDLCSKFQQKKKISAIDVDIYVNRVDDKHLEEAVDLVNKLRTTSQASKILDSTQHAVVRLSLTNDDMLISILNNRLDYGIFLDSYSANLLLDKFLKEKNYMLAARVATLQMLQESFDHPVTNFMSLFACYKFLDNIETFNDLVPPTILVAEEQQKTKSKKKPEEKKVRVAYLRNPYYDDHFDMKNTNHLVGKTFLYLADEIKNIKDNDTLSNSVKLLGYALYEKYNDGIKFLQQSQKLSFHKEVIDKIKPLAEKAENLNDEGKQFYDSINNITSMKDDNVSEIIENQLKTVVNEYEAKDIESQKKLFETWLEVREQTLNEEINRMRRIQRLEEIERMQDDLEKQEKKLWFFEKYEDIQLEIESKRVYYPKRWFDKKKKPKKLDESYVPPDVESITRARLAK